MEVDKAASQPARWETGKHGETGKAYSKAEGQSLALFLPHLSNAMVRHSTPGSGPPSSLAQ